MVLSNKTYSVLMLLLSIIGLLYMFFVVIIIPILPLDEDNILSSISQMPILLCSAICGLIFCGSLSVFTIFVMGRGHWTHLWYTAKNKFN